MERFRWQGNRDAGETGDRPSRAPVRRCAGGNRPARQDWGRASGGPGEPGVRPGESDAAARSRDRVGCAVRCTRAVSAETGKSPSRFGTFSSMADAAACRPRGPGDSSSPLNRGALSRFAARSRTATSMTVGSGAARCAEFRERVHDHVRAGRARTVARVNPRRASPGEPSATGQRAGYVVEPSATGPHGRAGSRPGRRARLPPCRRGGSGPVGPTAAAGRRRGVHRLRARTRARRPRRRSGPACRRSAGHAHAPPSRRAGPTRTGSPPASPRCAPAGPSAPHQDLRDDPLDRTRRLCARVSADLSEDHADRPLAAWWLSIHAPHATLTGLRARGDFAPVGSLPPFAGLASLTARTLSELHDEVATRSPRHHRARHRFCRCERSGGRVSRRQARGQDRITRQAQGRHGRARGPGEA